MEAAANGAAKKASAAAAIAEAAERLIGVKVEDPAEAARLRRLRRNKQQSVLEEEEKARASPAFDKEGRITYIPPPIDVDLAHKEARRRERQARRKAQKALEHHEKKAGQWISNEIVPDGKKPRGASYDDEDDDISDQDGPVEPASEATLFTTSPMRSMRKASLSPVRRTSRSRSRSTTPPASPLRFRKESAASLAPSLPDVEEAEQALAQESPCPEPTLRPRSQETKVLLVASGAYNPIHKMHLRMLYLARQFLERAGMEVVGGIISPSHATLVRQKQRRNVKQIIPQRHRLNMARLMVGGSQWLTVDAWEITRRRIMDYLSVLHHVREVAERTWPGHTIRVVYLTKPYGMLRLSPEALRENGYGCLCVCRPVESERLLKQMAIYGSHENNPWEGVAHVVEDAAMLTHELERTTSAAVREDLIAGRDVDSMVGVSVSGYAVKHRLGGKMAGEEKWKPQEKEVRWCEEDGVRPYRTEPPEVRQRLNSRSEWATAGMEAIHGPSLGGAA
mmetsp:Transcript_14315/g.42934  ORF Transcript_14315/g.42934 Transcript_14315/m.42934 type:complete len:508 (+) Transcript_14315:926-2449(+)